MITLLKEEEADYIKACIIEGQETIDIPVVPLQEYIFLFSDLGFIRDELRDDDMSDDSNFYLDFTHKEFGTYILSGSLWYGDYTISKEED